MLTALDLMKTAALKTSALYADISEIYAWKNDEFIIYTVNGGTPIYLGRGDLIKQLFILANFQSLSIKNAILPIISISTYAGINKLLRKSEVHK
jgi:hypothetical protein